MFKAILNYVKESKPNGLYEICLKTKNQTKTKKTTTTAITTAKPPISSKKLVAWGWGWGWAASR